MALGKPLKRFDIYMDQELGRRSLQKSKFIINFHRVSIVKAQFEKEYVNEDIGKIETAPE
jgi:hypothetical protein